MSTGVFSRTFYEANNGDIYRIRIQPETAQAVIGGTANSAPAGPATVGISAKVSKSRNEIGLGARKVSIFTANPPANYAGNTAQIAVLTPALYDGLNGGESVTYLGATWEVVGFLPETRR